MSTKPLYITIDVSDMSRLEDVRAALIAAGWTPPPDESGVVERFAAEWFERSADGEVTFTRRANAAWPEWATEAAKRWGWGK